MSKEGIDLTKRNPAIDILRAVTMLLMIFVNDFASVKGIPHWMKHAAATEDMLGFSDIIFPVFLFVVGMSVPYAIERRFSKGLSELSTMGHILVRSLALIIMGVFTVNTGSGVSPGTGFTTATFTIVMVTAFFLVWNVYPETHKKTTRYLYSGLKISGLLIMVYLAFIFRDANGGVFTSRWWGILGLIGWAYLVCAMIYLFVRSNLKMLAGAWLVFLVLCFLKSPLKDGLPILNLAKGNFLDQMLNVLAIGNGGHNALVMAGILLSLTSAKYVHLKNAEKLKYAALITGILFLLAVISNRFWIISKIQVTPPWILYCTGIAVALYSLFYWLAEKGKTHWFNIIKTAGTATLTCYLVPYVVYAIFTITGFHWPAWLNIGFVGLVKCMAFSLLIIGITHLLGKLHIKLKI